MSGIERIKLPMNIQFFAEPGNQGEEGKEPGMEDKGAASGQIDYAKIQQMLDGTLAAKEDTALKAYFRQQGLSQEEAEQAMASFKAEKAKNQPDIGAMQTKITALENERKQSEIRNAATLAAVGLGLDVKAIPYILKMADLGQVTEQDGKVSEESVKNALEKVLEAFPALKPQSGQASGFVKIGASGSGQGQTSDDVLKKAFGL